ncbi:hypothetical protein [Bradyrhizobium sp. LMG 9283]|uniref:hypothetical protein n=1 Tax=Bradyrhizobium sp. LMG 9283 TaxID=592064 RepID=UPI003890FF16
MLTKSKREVDDRLARVFENFNALDALRKDIGGIFATIRDSLNRIGDALSDPRVLRNNK